MTEYTDYQKGFIDAIVDVFASLFDEMDEQMIEIVLGKLQLKKVNEDED